MSLASSPSKPAETVTMADSVPALTPRNSNYNTPRTTAQKPPTLRHPDMNKPIYSAFDDEDIENNLPTDDSVLICPRSPSPSVAVDTLSPSPPPAQMHSPRRRRQSPVKAVVLENPTTPPAEGAFIGDEQEYSGGTSVPGDTSNGSIELDGANDTPSPADAPHGYSGMDDTNFTAFSAVANTDMTLLAEFRHSPKKSPPSSPAKALRQAHYGDAQRTPRPKGHLTPASTMNDPYTDGSPSPSPRRPKSSHEPDTTNLILDFTEQFNAISRPSLYKGNRKSPQKSQTQPDLASYLSGRRAPSPTKQTPRPTTPPGSRHLASLLDFDFPPAPTPRSIPSITARELESLKSSFLSQVSSLRATLSGKEAEANSLKEAVADAERRVGEALEEIRELKNAKADLQAEKDAWGSREKEMQNVLRKVKEEVMWADRERDEVQQKLEECEARCLAAEARTVEVECQLAGLENSDAMTLSGKGTPEEPNNVNESVRVAVLKLAQDLHGLYKSKHEVKIVSLKGSYERRFGRQIGTLETKVADLRRENEDLRAGKDVVGLSRVGPAEVGSPRAEIRAEPDQSAMKERAAEAKRREEQEAKRREEQEAKRREEQEAKRRKEQDAKLHEMEEALASSKRSNEALLDQLELERVALAELVAATEEMMQLSELEAVAANNNKEEEEEQAGGGGGGPNASRSIESLSLRGAISRNASGSGSRVLSNGNGSIGGASGFGSGLGAGMGAGTAPSSSSGESRIGKIGPAGRGFGIPSSGAAGGAAGGGVGVGGGGGAGARNGFKGRP